MLRISRAHRFETPKAAACAGAEPQAGGTPVGCPQAEEGRGGLQTLCLGPLRSPLIRNSEKLISLQCLLLLNSSPEVLILQKGDRPRGKREQPTRTLLTKLVHR